MNVLKGFSWWSIARTTAAVSSIQLRSGEGRWPCAGEREHGQHGDAVSQLDGLVHQAEADELLGCIGDGIARRRSMKDVGQAGPEVNGKRVLLENDERDLRIRVVLESCKGILGLREEALAIGDRPCAVPVSGRVLETPRSTT